MIRDICKDETFLAQKAEPAVPEDLPVAADLLETLEAHKEGCVGMAANMIGVNKRIIAFDNEGTYMVMFNPEIIKKPDPVKNSGIFLLKRISLFFMPFCWLLLNVCVYKRIQKYNS